jgi:hypothetical protein
MSHVSNDSPARHLSTSTSGPSIQERKAAGIQPNDEPGKNQTVREIGQNNLTQLAKAGGKDRPAHKISSNTEGLNPKGLILSIWMRLGKNIGQVFLDYFSSKKPF